MQRFTRFRTNLRNLRISQDICYERMTDIVNILTIYGQRAHVLNNNLKYRSEGILLIFLAIYCAFLDKHSPYTLFNGKTDTHCFNQATNTCLID